MDEDEVGTIDPCYVGIWTPDGTVLPEADWEEIISDVHEFLSKHPKFHTIDFAINLEEAW